MSTDLDIAVIGAGAAGIGAARRLAGSGLKVLVIEAAPRAGGRAWTWDIAGLRLDMGCAWLHSASRNIWAKLAGEAGHPIDKRESVWRTQFRDLGFTPAEQEAARRSFEDWIDRMDARPPQGDIAAAALEPGNEWNESIRAKVGFISGGELERMSAADYMAYENASTDENWRLPRGYGTLVAAHMPPGTDLRLSTPVRAIGLTGQGVALETPDGTLRARAVIVTVSTAMLAEERVGLPAALAPWREAASALPLGRDEKLFLEIVENGPFAPETHVIGHPRRRLTASYNIRAMGNPVIECYVGLEGAAVVAEQGPAAGFAFVMDELTALFGGEARRCLRPLLTTNWTRATHIGGSYSYALPGQSSARAMLARPFEDRIFFAGEATRTENFSTAHGAYESGARAAEEALAAVAGAFSPPG